MNLVNDKQTMTTKDLVTIAAAALGTATLTVITFWTGPLGAGNDADAPPPKIPSARLVSRGVEFGLAPARGRTFKAGDQPEFELTALNTTDQPASVSVGVTMTSAAPPNPLARVILMPSVLWERQQLVMLNPGETKVLTLCANTNLPAYRLMSVSLRSLDTNAAPALAGSAALSFSTATSQSSPTVALFK